MNEEELKKYYAACKLIIEHYGIDNQKKQLIQELAELIVAVTKNDLQNIIEEMADVQVMLDQFIINDPELDRKMSVVQLEKIERQLKRIETEKYGLSIKNNIRLKDGIKEKRRK